LLAVEQFGPRRLVPRLAVEGDFKPQRHEPFANVLDRLSATANGFRDLGVGPGRTVGIGFQKDLGAADLLGRTPELFDHRRQRGPFRIREPNDILLLHGPTLRGCGHDAKKPRLAIP
jgi:hypothetical protein